MLESLRIKCPSCGIILDVRNSKNEAVKQIICPHCKRQLAVDFEEDEPQQDNSPRIPLGTFYCGVMCLQLQEGVNQLPLEGSQHIEVRCHRLADGSSKCIVKALTASYPIKVNGQQLVKDDEVVLSIGDEVQLGNATLSFGKKLECDPQPPVPPIPFEPPKRMIWPYLVVALCIMIGFSVWHFWPEQKQEPKKRNDQKEISIDKSDKKAKDSPQKQTSRTTSKESTQPKPAATSLAKLTDMELELKAKNNVEAQYEYGKRKVLKGDSVSIVIGANYLRLAAKNGYSDANAALQKVCNQLEHDAANGNNHARNLLEVIK